MKAQSAVGWKWGVRVAFADAREDRPELVSPSGRRKGRREGGKRREEGKGRESRERAIKNR